MTKYAVKDFIDPDKLQRDLSIEQSNLDFGMIRQSGLFAYYGSLAAKAEQQMHQMEQMQEIIEARLDRKVRDEAAAEGRKITEPQVRAAVALEPKAIAIKTAVNRARMVHGICKSTAESFRHRRDMLIQLAFNDRHEKKGDLRVMDRQLDTQQAQAEQRNLRMQGMFGGKST